MRLTVDQAKHAAHDKLAEDVAEFLARGGKVERYALGERSDLDLSPFANTDRRKKEQDKARLNRQQKALAQKRVNEARAKEDPDGEDDVL